jgi:hypothetical protein
MSNAYYIITSPWKKQVYWQKNFKKNEKGEKAAASGEKPEKLWYNHTKSWESHQR